MRRERSRAQSRAEQGAEHRVHMVQGTEQSRAQSREQSTGYTWYRVQSRAEHRAEQSRETDHGLSAGQDTPSYTSGYRIQGTRFEGRPRHLHVERARVEAARQDLLEDQKRVACLAQLGVGMLLE